MAWRGEKTPTGRPAQPDNISPASVYLASEADGSDITGEVITPLGSEVTAGEDPAKTRVLGGVARACRAMGASSS